MCGIAGILFHQSVERPDPVRLAEMSALLRHRGPDNSGQYVSDGVGLVHTRLALLDLNPRSDQPLWDGTGRFAIVYNGEVYNFRELRDELESRHAVKFRTTGDTEVVLQAILAWGPRAALLRMEGMFALALYDAEERSLLLCRDRFGIKPLWISDSAERLVFASEVSAFRPWMKMEPDPAAVSAYLLAGETPMSGPSMFRGVQILEPGTWATVRRGQRPDHKAFFHITNLWDPDEFARLRSAKPGAVVDTVDGLLQDSVAKQLVADAPVGVLCSGGLDSSVVAAMAARRHGNIAVFHANVCGDDSEHAWALAVARHIGVELRTVDVARRDFTATIPEVTTHYGVPFSYHPNSVPFKMVAELVRKSGVKAVLSGEGADETFLGYDWVVYDVGTTLRRFRTSPIASLRRIVGWLLDRPGPPPFTQLSETTLMPALLGRFEHQLAEQEIRNLRCAHPSGWDHRVETSMRLLGYHLRTLLHRNDCLGMAASIEARFPFLDSRLVRYAVNLPNCFTNRKEWNARDPRHPLVSDKWVLRKVAERYLPRAIAHRHKAGFPVSAWDQVRLSPGFLRASFVADYLQLSDAMCRLFCERAPSRLAMRVACLEAWGQLLVYGSSCDEVRCRLSRLEDQNVNETGAAQA